MDQLNAMGLTLLIAIFPVFPIQLARAEDNSELSSAQADPALQLTQKQWQERVRSTKLRIQQQQAARRRIPPADNRPTEEAERASEQVLNDNTLIKGDIVITDKGMFVFKGRNNEEHKISDFDPIENSKLR